MNIQEDLKAYLDGELTEAQADAVRNAIANDLQLQQEVREMSLITESLQSSDTVTTNAPGREAVINRVKRKKPRRAWLAWAGAVCGVALMAAVMFPVFGQSKNASLAGAEMASRASSTPMAEDLAKSPVPNESADQAAANTPEPYAKLKAPATATPSANRDVVRTAVMEVSVLDVQETVGNCTQQVTAMGGYLQSTSEASNESQQPVAHLEIKVPSEKFTAAVMMVRNLGNVVSSTITGEDITAQRVEAEARAKDLRKQELYYMEMLRGARRESAANEIRWKIREIREEISAMDKQARDVKIQASYSTIDLNLVERPKAVAQSEGWANDVLGSATNTLMSIGRVLASAGIYILVLAPIWLPAILIARYVKKRAS